MYDKNNIFAKIINNSAPADIVYQDENIMAFKDISPVAPVHIIVIPKKQYTDYSDFICKALPEEIKNYFMKLADIAELVGLKDEGYRLVANQGANSGQTVFHFHFHIIGGKKFSALY